MPHARIVAALLLAGSLIAGLGFCALLPPFEGFDETAHYSYMAQIAQRGSWPRLFGPMSAEIDDYLARAPSASIVRWNYYTFFAAPAAVQQEGAQAAHGARERARPWRDGAIPNWEGQHPPFYYAVLAPLWRASMGWSLYAQLVLLRAVSYLFAWSALVIVTVSLWRSAALSGSTLMLAPALWPALFPMWFPEMARLGNDSLLLLLTTFAWLALRKALRPGRQLRAFAGLGALCGLAAVTKATALPFIAALVVFLGWRLLRARRDPAERRIALGHLAVFALAAILVGSWWYIDNRIEQGSFFLADMTARLAQHGGWAAGLAKYFSWPKAIIGTLENARSFVWTGTWSFIFLPRGFEVPLSLLLTVIGAAWIWRVAKDRALSSMDAIVLGTLGLFMVGLLQQTLAQVALMGGFLIGAWYFHSLMPLLAPLIGRGLDETARWGRARPLVGALIVYAPLFLLFATCFFLTYYAGCLPEAPGARRYALGTIAACLARPGEIVDRLAVLGAPKLALPLFTAGWLLLFAGTVGYALPRYFCREVGRTRP